MADLDCGVYRSGLRKSLQALDLLAPMSKSGKDPRLFLSLRLGERFKPGFDKLLREEALLHLAMKPVFEVCLLVQISKSAEPQLPGLHIARRDAHCHAIQVLAGQSLIAEGILDLFLSPLKADDICIDDHQQADSLTGSLPEVPGHICKAGQDESEAAIASARLDADAVKQPLEDRTKQLLLLDILAEQ
jgi:hypothetical protein